MYQENPNDLHYPVILRCTGPSDAWLSPTHNEAVCYFGFVVYYDADRSISERGLAFLRSVEKMLAGEGGRPHWGKYFNPLLYDWAALYANWENFREVRAMADPKGKFLNHYLRGLLGATA